MNKFLLASLLFIQTVSAQVVSISPNSADFGQTLNTTITLAGGVINIGSPPMQNGDIYLQQGTQRLYASNFTLSSPFPPYDDTINVTFSIPPVVPPGLYDVHVFTYQSFPFPQPVDNVLTNGFTIHPAPHFISGKVYTDLNQNGIMDVNEHGLTNVHVNINPGNYTILTDTAGDYSFFVDTGAYVISISPPPGYIQTSTPSAYNITVPPDSSGNDFGIYFPIPNPLTQSFWITTHPMRCLFTGFSSWHVRNNTPVDETGSITVIHSPNLTFNTSSFSPTSISGDTLSWNYSLLSFNTLNCSVNYNNPAAGDTVWYLVIDSVFDAFGVFQQVYSDSFQFVVSCSVDPNDKHVSPAGEGPMHLTLTDSELTYLINFQNTGTDTAYNVQILDTLDANLDQTTIELLGSSDPVAMTLQANGAIRFMFDNILLPDSNIDEPGSHGYVSYRIKPMQSLPDSTVIENTAYIYFDFNLPVVTNTAFNTYVSLLPVSVRAIQSEQTSLIYPNPVSQLSILDVPPGMYKLHIYDIRGKEIVSRDVFEKYIINNSDFPEGVYFYRLTNNSNSLNGKFIIVK